MPNHCPPENSLREWSEPYRRHARHFRTILQRAATMYDGGGDGIDTGLELFDEKWENIKVAQGRAADCATVDTEAAELSIGYGLASDYLLALRLTPLDHLNWLKAARPNLVGDPRLPRLQRTVERWFNTNAFTLPSPAPQAFGNAGVGIMRGPGLANFDLSIAKDIKTDESRHVQFRTELFNAFNHANFGPPDIRRDASTFGRILSASSARIIQFALKVYF